MKKLYSGLVIIFLCAGLTGCAYFNTAFRTYDNQNNSVMVDVKQRAIISGKRFPDQSTVICAEPSPDAMSAYAAELAGSVTTPQQIKGEVAAAFQEGSAYIGLRTQSIQLLRDSMFRLCESYMNGAIGATHYDLLARRYQKNMVALLAIEQLTGTVKVAPITINTQGSATIPQAIDELLKAQEGLNTKRDSINSEITKLNGEIEGYKTQLEKDPKNEELANKKTGAEAKVKVLKGNLENVQSALKQLDDAFKNPRTFTAGGSTSSYVNQEAPQTRSDTVLTAIASSVEKIVSQIIEGDDSLQMCLTFYSGLLSPDSKDKTPMQLSAYEEMKSICKVILTKKDTENQIREINTGITFQKLNKEQQDLLQKIQKMNTDLFEKNLLKGNVRKGPEK